MGVLDPLAGGLWYATGLGRKSKKFKHTDPATFKASLGDFFIFLVSKRNPDFLQGGIQGGQQQQDDKLDDTGSFWQHGGGGFKQPDGSFITIEAFGHGVNYGKLDKYLTDEYQLEAYSFPIIKEQINFIWMIAKQFIGLEYDKGELVCDVLPKELAEIFDDKNKYVCSSLWAVIMNFFGWKIVRPKVNPYRATPGDIQEGCYRQMRLKYSSFNIG